MKPFKTITVLSFTSLVGLTACQKNNDVPPQPDKVTINIISPKPGATYHPDDTVYIKATINYISRLHGYELDIKNKTTDSTLFSTEEHTHSDNFSIDTYWVNTTDKQADMQLEITAEIDHDGNTGSNEITFKSQP